MATGQQRPSSPGQPAVEVVSVAGRPELHVDGKPFFVHSATFFYFRIPRDLWGTSLDRHRELGINTIDLLIPWNWHEAQEGKFDFEGRTNPRRDLRGLLQLLSEKGFKVIARAAPGIGADWPNDGRPAWLAPNHETEGARIREWLRAVAKELAPFDASRSVTVRMRNEKGDFESKTISGPIILLQASNVAGAGLPSGGNGATDSTVLREIFVEAGLEAPFFMHLAQDDAAANRLPAMGEWFPAWPAGPSPEGMIRDLSPRDAAEVESAVQRLNGQAGLPPMLIGFQAGWRTPGDDARPPESHPAGTLLAWRLALGYGARGINYFPLQDSLTPAGFETPGANRHYRWDAALDLAGNEHARSRSIARNARIVAKWGEQLAASHVRADFGVVLSRSAEDVYAAKQISRILFLAGLSFERVDLDTQPDTGVTQHAVLILPPRQVPLSPEAQRKLADYVRGGGTLVIVPPHPPGEIIRELWDSAEVVAETPGLRKTGAGRVMEVADFFSWVELEEDFVQTRMRGEETAAETALQGILRAAGVRPVVQRAVSGPATGALAVSQIASNAGTGPLGTRTRGAGFLVVTNLSTDESADEEIAVLPASASVTGSDPIIRLPLQVPTHESLLLPLNQPLCATAKPSDNCKDEVVGASIEILEAERDGRTLILTFYAPSKGTVLLRLARQPGRVQMEEFRMEANWLENEKLLRLQVPRGAWPDFKRVLKIFLPYEPFLPEPPKKKAPGRTDFDFSVAESIKLPLGNDASLASEPPLILLDKDCHGQILMQGTNYDELGRLIDFRVDGVTRGSDGTGISAFDTRQVLLNLKGIREACSSSVPDGEGLLRGQVEARSGRDRRQMLLYFVSVPEEGVAAYHLDFDRDGAKEWVLENKGLRLMVSPEWGGRAVGLVDKVSRRSLLSSVGGAIDEPGRDGYSGQWIKDAAETRLALGDGNNRVTKTFRLAGPDVAIVDYRLPSGGDRFAALNSLPARPGERGTEFCWKEPAPEENAICEPFLAGGALELPGEVRAVDIREAGRPLLTVEWDSGKMQIEMKNFSALLRLVFPAGAETNQVRYRVKPEE